MKKYALLFVVLITSNVYSESLNNIFTDSWELKPFISEFPDGQLVSSFSDYSFPYSGIKRLDFFDDSFVVISIQDQDFKAFFDVETHDFDNIILNFTLKNGELLKLKLTKGQNEEWLYFYRIPENSILYIENFNLDPLQSKKKDTAEKESSTTSNQDIEKIDKESKTELLPVATFIGVMKRLKK